MDDAFLRAFRMTLAHEGGFSNDPHDSGGATNYGLSQRQYPHLDIKALTLADAQDRYLEDYWLRFRCDALPTPLALVFFDCVFNHAPENPIRWLQSAVGARVDGKLGPRTLATVGRCPDVPRACGQVTLARIEYVKTLPTFPRFGKGWHARHVGVLVEALRP